MLLVFLVQHVAGIATIRSSLLFSVAPGAVSCAGTVSDKNFLINSLSQILPHRNKSACGSCGMTNGNFTDCNNDQCIPADGVERGLMSINREIPGPSTHVCQNDLIVVDVTNSMSGTSAAIHW